MTWVWLTIGSVLLFTIFNLLLRLVAVETKSPRVGSFVFNLTAALFSILIFLFSGKLSGITLPKDQIAWVYLGIALLFYGLTERIRFSAAKMLDASILSTISNVSTPIAFIGSIFLYQEVITANKIIGTILIFIALILVTFEKGKIASAKGVGVALLYSTFLAIGWTLDKKGATYFSPVIYNLLVWTVPLVVIFVPYIKPKDIVNEYRIASWKFLLLSTVCVTAYLMQLQAVTKADASQVVPIIQTSTLFTILAGTIFLKERTHLVKKFVAGAVAVAGVFLLV